MRTAMKRKAKEIGKGKVSSLSSAALIKGLGSTNAKDRNRALHTLLGTWLPSQTEISEEDMRKLWKGLFYCFWHSDKLPEQSRLADRLSSMILDLPAPISLEFFSVFLLTMRREWGGIDFLRLDKFYLLIRRFLHGGFSLLKRCSWDLEIVSGVIRTIMERTFLDTENSKGNGVNYHVASVFLEELKSFLPLRKEVTEAIFVPFVEVTGKVVDKILLKKLKNCLFDEIANAGRKLLNANDTEEGKNDVTAMAFIGPGIGFSDLFYKIGASSECVQGNRKLIFQLHQLFSKLEKDYESSKIQVRFPDITEEGEEIPLLVPIDEESKEIHVNGNIETKGIEVNGNISKSDKKKQKKKSTQKKEKKKSKENDVCINPIEQNCDVRNENVVDFNESVISNLQLQFDKVANELSLDTSTESCCSLKEADILVSGGTKKRKKGKDNQILELERGTNGDLPESNGENETSIKTGERSTKKVKFSMKNNLVWKPHNPLPPQDLRLPPSATPRGSALKKGVPPGPIRDVATSSKKAKARAKILKKSSKGLYPITPITRRKKPKSLSA